MIYFVIGFRADCDVIRSETLWDEQQSKLGRKSRSLYALKKGKGFSGGGGRVTFFHAAFKESISDEERRDLTVAAALTSMGGLYTAERLHHHHCAKKKREEEKKYVQGEAAATLFLSAPSKRESSGVATGPRYAEGAEPHPYKYCIQLHGLSYLVCVCDYDRRTFRGG